MASKPTATILDKAKPKDVGKTITDSKDRVLIFKKLSILENARLMRACGDASAVDKFFDLAVVCCGVREIDGVPQPMPKTLNEVDGRIGLVGDEGWAAIISNLIPAKPTTDDDEEIELTPPNQIEQLKN